MEEMLEDVVVAKRLRWVGHVACMDDSHLPKRDFCLDGYLSKDLLMEVSYSGGME